MLRKRVENGKAQKNNAMKLLVGAFVVSVGIGSGQLVFADQQNIGSLLTDWFYKKTNESVSQINDGIAAQKDASLKQLKQQLQTDIGSSKTELDKFTEQEKQKRVEDLQNYTQQLMNNLQVKDDADRKKILKQMDDIVQQAQKQMDEVKSSSQNPSNGHNPPGQGGNGQGDNNGNHNGNNNGNNGQ